jgi:hypothetical protein
MNNTTTWDRLAIVLATFLGLAGIQHFANPDFCSVHCRLSRKHLHDLGLAR